MSARTTLLWCFALVTPLQAQTDPLGLKLESSTSMVDSLIIERLERPTED